MMLWPRACSAGWWIRSIRPRTLRMLFGMSGGGGEGRGVGLAFGRLKVGESSGWGGYITEPFSFFISWARVVELRKRD